MLLQEVQQVIDNPECCGTLVLDTIDWAEAKAIEAVCTKQKVAGIEDIGWGKATRISMKKSENCSTS
jgi:hypothetical protein